MTAAIPGFPREHDYGRSDGYAHDEVDGYAHGKSFREMRRALETEFKGVVCPITWKGFSPNAKALFVHYAPRWSMTSATQSKNEFLNEAVDVCAKASPSGHR